MIAELGNEIEHQTEQSRRYRADQIRQVLRVELRSTLGEWMLKHLSLGQTGNRWRYIDGSIPEGKRSRYSTEIIEFYLYTVPRLLNDTKASQSLKDEVQKALDGKIVVPTRTGPPEGSAQSPKLTAKQKKRLIEDTFAHFCRMDSSQLHRKTELKGDYFGYRRSANLGEIIRFYIRFWPDQTGYTRFVNFYHRGKGLTESWRVEGFGFKAGEVTYLIGHAASEHRELGLGMRFFALREHQFGWFVGPILSMDTNRNPIAARIVLVPVEHHQQFASLNRAPTEMTMIEAQARHYDSIMHMIRDPITPEALEEEIGLEGEKSDSLALEIQSLIWNGTFTTLHDFHPELHTLSAEQYGKLFAFEERARQFAKDIENMGGHANAAAPFIRIIQIANDILPKRGTAEYRKIVASVKKEINPARK